MQPFITQLNDIATILDVDVKTLITPTKQRYMIFKLETPEHQRTAIQSVVEVFRGMERNTYDNATDEDIRANYYNHIFKKPGTHVSKWRQARVRP